MAEARLSHLKRFIRPAPHCGRSRWRGGGHRARSKAAALVGMMLCAIAAPLLGAEAAEYEVKAAFLYNLARFVEWPKEALEPEAAQFHLCVYGEDPFDGALAVIEGKQIDGKEIVVQRVGQSEGVANCQMVFVSASQRHELGPLISKLVAKPVLTVGDTPGYGKDGVIVNFYIEQRKVRFEINVQAAKSAGLKVSSKLLALARII